MAWYPCAERAPVAWMNAIVHTRKTQLAVHITAGESDPRTIETWRTGRAGANFVIFRDGRTVQLADSACRSAADFGAPHIISVECVGKDGPLTPAQVQALIRLARDAHQLDGVPLRLAATSSDAGIGWHRLGVDGNFPTGRLGGRLQRSPLGVKTSGARGKLCPTDAVIHQIHDEILPALTDGRTPTTTTHAPAPAPVPDVQEDDDMRGLIEALYRTRIGRSGSTAEVDRWTVSAAEKNLKPEEIVAEFGKARAEGATVEYAYREFLGRTATKPEVASWMAKNLSVAAVREQISKSPEATKKKG
ncbi:peptidoglycan recognition protein family protein [Cellulosimicrobium sp. Marseille-Q8652]